MYQRNTKEASEHIRKQLAESKGSDQKMPQDKGLWKGVAKLLKESNNVDSGGYREQNLRSVFLIMFITVLII